MGLINILMYEDISCQVTFYVGIGIHIAHILRNLIKILMYVDISISLVSMWI